MKSDDENKKDTIRRKNNRTDDCWIIFRSHLLKMTATRVTIVHIFQKAEEPLSAQDVFEISNLSLATIYRTIKILQEIRFLRQSYIKEDTVYYEI
jgi:Fe2+ or Zn2+ uptake regulation protein